MEEVVGYSYRLQDLEERGQGYGGANQVGEDGFSGGSSLLERDVKVMVRVASWIFGEMRKEGFYQAQ